MTTLNIKQKPVFTRVTLDAVSLQAVQKIQQAIPNYTINDAIKMILGIGIKNLNLDNSRLPDQEEQKAIDNFIKNPDLVGLEESENFLKELKSAIL